jgi:hypothetical protein|tara:strand:+ start:114 stop:338 length:225 start_codon:yes stop_codon:yes gene_type:complete
MSKEAEVALQKAIDEEREHDPLFDIKTHVWNSLNDKHNTTGFSMMQLNETKDGQKKVAEISAKIAKDMTRIFGD